MWECQPDGELKERPYVDGGPGEEVHQGDDGDLGGTGDSHSGPHAAVDYETAEITENYKRDFRWVYTNYGKHVQKSDSPSEGAWGLREWAKENRNGFYTLASKLLTVDKSKDDKRHEDDAREVFAVLKKAGINL